MGWEEAWHTRFHSYQPRVAVDGCVRLAIKGIESHESKPGYKECVCDGAEVEIDAGS